MSDSCVEKPHSRVHTCLVIDQRTLRFLPGSYVVGRGNECDIVLDDLSVSRRHARLLVELDGASIEDLQSANGVYVNGSRIDAPEQLRDGDGVVVGEHELAVQLIPHSTLPPPRETLPAISTMPPQFDAPATERVATLPETARANALELLGMVAERALALGNASQAERAVGARLLELLNYARREPGSIRADATARAVELALRLARAGCGGRWLDYALELMAAISLPCSESLAAEFRATAATTVPHAQALDLYARAISVLQISMEKSRTLALIDELRAPRDVGESA